MNIALGIHIGHDRGTCIIKDAKVLACISQERIDRIKYSSSSNIPFDAIDKLLEYCSIDINDISCVGLSYDGIENDSILNIYKSEFFEYYFCNNIPFYFVSHHDAHAYASFFSSGFEDALVFVADGGGDYHGDAGIQAYQYPYVIINIFLFDNLFKPLLFLLSKHFYFLGGRLGQAYIIANIIYQSVFTRTL